MNEAHLRLAHAGLDPARLGRLLGETGSAAAAVRALVAGRYRLSDDAVEALKCSTAALAARLQAVGARFVPRTELFADLAPPEDPLLGLFVRGSLPPVPGVAVVGSRRATRYGLGVAEAIGRRLAAAGRVVVSGLARGIDGAAHRGCVAAGGVGVAVLGSGIDVWYPAEHRTLGEELVAGGGAVVSEYPPGTPPAPWRFPCRNRLIVGISAAVIVVEAAAKSGALITAREALERGRDVYVVPGDIDRPTSEGCNRLIQDGAHPICGLDDLDELLDLRLGSAGRDLSTQVGPVGRPVEDLLAEAEDPRARLVELGRLEAAGKVRIEEGIVYGLE